MCNTNYIVLNEREHKDRYFFLEKQVWIYTGNHKNTCAFIFFDCSREEIAYQEMAEEKWYNRYFISKGSAVGDAKSNN